MNGLTTKPPGEREGHFIITAALTSFRLSHETAAGYMARLPFSAQNLSKPRSFQDVNGKLEKRGKKYLTTASMNDIQNKIKGI
jgi:hypothetical protein